MKSLYSNSGGPTSALVFGHTKCCPINLRSFLWVIYGSLKDIETQHFFCFPNVGAMRGALFLPVGTWKTWWAFLAGLDVSGKGAKPPAEQAEVQMCVGFDFHWELRKKYFDLILQFSFSLAQSECSASDQKCPCLICIGSHPVIRHNQHEKNKQPPHWRASEILLLFSSTFLLWYRFFFKKRMVLVSSWSVCSGKGGGGVCNVCSGYLNLND